FKEFASFLDGVGLPAEWSPYLLPPERESELPEPALQYPRTAAGTPAARPNNDTRPGTPFSPWLPSAPGAARTSANLTEHGKWHDISKVVGLSRLDILTTSRGRHVETGSRVTDDQRARLKSSLEAFRRVVGTDFKLPS